MLENYRSSNPPKQQSTPSKPIASTTIVVKELPSIVEEAQNNDMQQREVPEGSISQKESETKVHNNDRKQREVPQGSISQKG